MNSLFKIPNVTGYDFNLLGAEVELVVHQASGSTTIQLLPAVEDKPIPMGPAPAANPDPSPVITLLPVKYKPRSKKRRRNTHKESRPYLLNYSNPRSNGTPTMTKLKEQEVREIRELWPTVLAESPSQNQALKGLAQIYNVSPTTINMIINGQTWKHVA